MLIHLTLLALQAPSPFAAHATDRVASPGPGPIGAEALHQEEEPKALNLSPEQWSGDPRFWSVQDGMLVGESTPENPCTRSSFIVHEASFADFDLSLEFMVMRGNSGVQFRSALKGEWNVVGYQADLEDGPNWIGGIYEQGGRGVLVRRSTSLLANGPNSDYDLLADPDSMKDIGRGPGWHTYRIRAEGRRIKLWVDGTLTCELDDRTDKAALEGLLALQLHQGPPMKVLYRNIRLLRLPPTEEVPRKWIRAAGKPAAKRVELERRLKATAELKRAVLKATSTGELSFALDGEVFAGGKDAPDHLEVELPGSALERLRDGKPHRLSATCESDVGPASISAVLELEYRDGRTEEVYTDRWWRQAGTKERATVLRPYAAAPWIEAPHGGGEDGKRGDKGDPEEASLRVNAPMGPSSRR